ncbi:MAG: cytochrome c oxidase subunit 3 [Spirosomataceae bacterium]
MSTNYSTKLRRGFSTGQRDPYQFMMWLGIAGSTLMFLSLLILSFFRKDSLGWEEIRMPGAFWLSSLLIFSSSVTLFEATLAFKAERFKHYRICLGLTFLLGLIFIVVQAVGWIELFEANKSIEGKNSSLYFIYLITGLHFLHILGGLAFMGILFTEAIRNSSYIDAFVYSVNGPNLIRIKMLNIFWHFIGVLWLVLFFVMLFYLLP